MEKNAGDEALIRELRAFTAKLNHLSEYVKTLNDRFEKAGTSEERLYAFLGMLVEKLLENQKRKNL